MPTYEYACTRCGQHVEVFQRLAEEPLTTCGACGGPLRKVFHPAGIVFKGSGFYATDSRSKPTSASSDGKHDEKKGERKGEKKGAPASGTSTDTPSSSSSSSSSSTTDGASAPRPGGEKAS
jgi:putative FmdB family regulatory protein